MLPYLGCALEFGVNPLKFLRERQKKHGPTFTCQLAGNYVHFLTDPFSYHAVIQQGRNLDWKKFHFATSAKVAFKKNNYSNKVLFLLKVGRVEGSV